MGIKQLSANQVFALALACLTGSVPSPNAYAGAEAAFQAAQAAQAATQAASTAAGLSEIMKGEQNQQQGQQTQNMAQMATGAMQIMSGLAGLMAAAAAGQKKDTAAGRDSGISSLGDGFNPNPYTNGGSSGGSNNGNTTGQTSTTGLGNSVTNGITAVDLKKEPISTALASIEKNFGIPPDKLVAAVANGVAPKDLFANAPKNAISADLANRIADGLAASSASSNADAAKSIAGALDSSGASNPGGAGTGAAPTGAVEVAGGTRAPASTEESLDDLNTAANMALSPEVRAAMAARAEQVRREKEIKEVHGWSIFQLVANRYRKLEPMLYGRVERTNPNPVPPQIRN